MRRQIIQTQTKGWTPAMRRRLVIVVALVVVLMVGIVIAMHGIGMHRASLGPYSTFSKAMTIQADRIMY